VTLTPLVSSRGRRAQNATRRRRALETQLQERVLTNSTHFAAHVVALQTALLVQQRRAALFEIALQCHPNAALGWDEKIFGVVHGVISAGSE